MPLSVCEEESSSWPVHDFCAVEGAFDSILHAHCVVSHSWGGECNLSGAKRLS